LLVLLVSQSAGTTLVLKLAQVQGGRPDNVVVMLLAELVKLGTSLVLFAAFEGRGRWSEELTVPIFFCRCGKLFPVAGLFALQNQLMIFGTQNLELPVYQAVSQLKIVSAGVFSFVLLRKRLTRVQWAALVVLACAAWLVQMDGSASVTAKAPNLINVDRAKGFQAVLFGCSMSGLAGCYTELMLKTGKLPMWLQSAVVAFVSAAMLSVTVVVQRGFSQLSTRSLLHGFVDMTWGVVLMMSLGGLIVVPVLRYADSILKSIAMIVALLLSTVLSVVLFDTAIGPFFCAAAIIICSSVFIYQSSERKEAPAVVLTEQGYEMSCAR